MGDDDLKATVSDLVDRARYEGFREALNRCRAHIPPKLADELEIREHQLYNGAAEAA